MKRPLKWLAALAAGTIWIASPHSAGTQERSGNAVLPHFEVFEPAAPMTLLAEDARKLVDEIQAQAAELEKKGMKKGILDPKPAKGHTRRIEVPAPEVVNTSKRFVFRDLTRGSPAPQGLSAEARRAAVEAYRQSLRKPGAALKSE